MQRDAPLENWSQFANAFAALGSPFMAALMTKMAQDLVAGGIVRTLLADWQGSPLATAPHLRLTGALHYAVLLGKAPALAAVYPKRNSSGEIDKAWAAATAFMRRETDWVRAFLNEAPQTNETRRAILLITGLMQLASQYRRPLHLLELGASAGLNQNLDRFNYVTRTWSRKGDSDVHIDTDWRGPRPPLEAKIDIQARAGCDVNPLSLSNREERLRLKSYIWPDQPDRLDRFDAAADLALNHGISIDRESADTWVRKRLAARPADTLTVVYHSVFFQYPPPPVRQAIQDAIERAGATATLDAPLAWMRFEPEAFSGGPRRSPIMVLDVVTWPGQAHHRLARSDGHATWVDYSPPVGET